MTNSRTNHMFLKPKITSPEACCVGINIVVITWFFTCHYQRQSVLL